MQLRWIILLDYDNTLTPEYLDSLFAIKHWKKNTIYCSAFAYPSLDFRPKVAGKNIDLDLISTWANSKDFDEKFFNDGNYFLPKYEHLEVLMPFRNYSVSASDVIFANYLWLTAGNVLKVLGNSWYIHRIHKQSTWIVNSEQSQRVVEPILRRIRGKIEADGFSMKDDFIETSNEWIEPAPIRLL